EVMHVLPRADDVFLDGVLHPGLDRLLEVLVILRDERAAAALRAVVLHEHGTVNVLRSLDLQRHRDAGGREPLPLLLAVRLPFQDLAVPEGRDGELREDLGAHVLDEGTVRHRDDLLRHQVLRLIEDVRVRIDDQEVVRLREGEGIVEPRLLPNRDPESPESLLARAMKDLERGMGTDRRDHDVPVVREDRRDGLPRYHYGTNRFDG